MSWVAVVSRCGAGAAAFAGFGAPATARAAGVAGFLPFAAGALAPPTSLLNALVSRFTALPAACAAPRPLGVAAGLVAATVPLRDGAALTGTDFTGVALRATGAFFATGLALAPRAAALRAGDTFFAADFAGTGFFAAGRAAGFFAGGRFATLAFFGAGLADFGAAFFEAVLAGGDFFAGAFFATGLRAVALAGAVLAAAFRVAAAAGFLFGLDFMGVLGFPWAASRRVPGCASLRRSGRVL